MAALRGDEVIRYSAGPAIRGGRHGWWEWAAANRRQRGIMGTTNAQAKVIGFGGPLVQGFRPQEGVFRWRQ